LIEGSRIYTPLFSGRGSDCVNASLLYSNLFKRKSTKAQKVAQKEYKRTPRITQNFSLRHEKRDKRGGEKGI